MTYDIKTNSILAMTPSGQQVSVNPEMPSSSIIIPFVDEEALKDQNLDCVTTDSSQMSPVEFMRNHIYRSIAAYLADRGISLDEAKKANFLERIAGCTTEELVNMPNEELNKVIDIATSGYRISIFKNEPEIDAMIHRAHKKYVRDLSDRSWVKELLRSHADVVEFLAKKGYLNTKTPSGKDIETALDKFFYDITNDAIQSGDTEKIKKAYDKAFEVFKDLNIDTVGEARGHLAHIISKLEAGSRFYAEKLALRGSNNSDERAVVAKGIVDNFKEIVTEKDGFNNVPDNNEAALIADSAYTHLTKEDLEQALNELYTDATKFFEEHKEEIEELKAKRDRGEKLSENEQKLLTEAENVYYAQYAGSMTGTSKNENLNNEDKILAYNKIFNDTESLGIKEEVVETVSEFIDNNPEVIFEGSKEEFVKLIDEATNNAYTEAIKQIEAENAKNAQNKPVNNQLEKPQDNKTEEFPVEEQKEVSTVSYSETITEETSNQVIPFGFETKSPVDTTKLEELTRQIKSKESQEEIRVEKNSDKSSDNIITATKTSEGFNEFIENNGALAAVAEVFNNLTYITNQGIVKKALGIYETFADGSQADTLRKVGNAGINLLIKHTSDSTLRNIKGETFSNFYATQQVEDAVEKVEEKRA